MTVEKIIPKDNSNKKEFLSENKWIHINLQNVKKHEGPKVSFLNQKGNHANQFDRLKVIDKLSNLKLINADIISPTLTTFGEDVCRKGGWLQHLRQKANIERLKRKEETEITKFNIENIKLQNENLEYQKTIREQSGRIATLTEDNLKIDRKLKRWQIWGFRWWLTGIVFSALTILLTHLKIIQIVWNLILQLVSRQ